MKKLNKIEPTIVGNYCDVLTRKEYSVSKKTRNMFAPKYRGNARLIFQARFDGPEKMVIKSQSKTKTENKKEKTR